MIKYIKILFLLFFVFKGNVLPQSLINADSAWKALSVILKSITRPVFPLFQLSILDFGAKGDGKTDCTEAFKKAIDSCAENGGGTVLVPEGIYLTGAIHLKSNINLHLTENSVIKFSTNPRQYLPVVLTRFEGVECMNYSPLVYAYGQKNIAVTGKGVLDGQGSNSNWWSWKGKKEFEWQAGMPDQNYDREKLFEMAENNVPVSERIFGEGHFLRPDFFQINNCENVLVEGVTFINSPMWFLHPVLSKNVSFINVNIEGAGPNNDGCDPESSFNVLIDSCNFNTGDDCIAIKSGRNNDGRRVNVPSENIIIRNCKMKDGHGGIVIGSETSGGIKNIYAENCVMSSPDLDRAIRIKTNAVRGGTIENLYVKNIKVGEVKEAVLKINYYYEEADKGSFIPKVRNIFLSNIKSDKSKYAVWIRAFENSPAENIHLDNCNFRNVSDQNIIEGAAGLETNMVFINDSEWNCCSDKKTGCIDPSAIDARRIFNSFIKLHPDTIAYKNEAKSYRWNYEQGLIAEAFYRMWKESGETEYLDYMKKNVDYYIDNDGNIKTYKLTDYNLDNIAPGRVLLNLFEKTKQEKYRKAADLLLKQIEGQPVTSEGGFWHKKRYPYQMWLDGLFMAEPFVSEYAELFHRPELFKEIADQFSLVKKHLKDPETGLYFHGWDESRKQKWADPATGRSPSFWGRSNGWLIMAMVDVLDYFPENNSQRDSIIQMIQDLSAALLKVRDPETKLWYQVLDQGNRGGNYIETSSSLMFIYSYLKGVRKGYLTKDYLNIAEESYHSVLENYVKQDEDGRLFLHNTVSVGGLGGDPYRDGSFSYYISEPIRINDFKGYGALMFASIEMMKIN